MRRLLLCVLLLLLLPDLALAATTQVDLTPILIQVVGGIFSVIGIVLTVVLPLVINKYVKDKQAAQVIEAGLLNSLGKLQQAGVDLSSSTIKNYRPTMPVPTALAPAVNYMFDHASDEMKRFGITDQSIADKIVSRIGLQNIETNKALTASAAQMVSSDGAQLPIVAPPLGPVPTVVAAILPVTAVAPAAA